MLIKIGNRVEGDRGVGHSWGLRALLYPVTDYDIKITEDDGQVFYYHLRRGEYDECNEISEIPEFEDSKTVLWEDLPYELRRVHYKKAHPLATEDQMNLAVYGAELGGQINQDNEWARTHLVYSRDITLALRNEIGEFKEIHFIKSYSRVPRSGYQVFVYQVDGYLVTVRTNSGYHRGREVDTFTVEDYEIARQAKIKFGRRVDSLAKTTGLPWEIASLAGQIDSYDGAIRALNDIKSAKEDYDGSQDVLLQSRELEDQINGIRAVLPDIVIKELNLGNRKHVFDLAKFFVST